MENPMPELASLRARERGAYLVFRSVIAMLRARAQPRSVKRNPRNRIGLMNPVWNVVTVATVTLAFNVVMRAFGGGWGLSRRFTKIETSMTAMQGEIKKLVEVMKEVANMNTSIRVAEQRQVDTERRVTALEDDFRELRKGNGWITHQQQTAFRLNADQTFCAPRLVTSKEIK
jgi:hypothetical protein